MEQIPDLELRVQKLQQLENAPYDARQAFSYDPDLHQYLVDTCNKHRKLLYRERLHYALNKHDIAEIHRLYDEIKSRFIGSDIETVAIKHYQKTVRYFIYRKDKEQLTKLWNNLEKNQLLFPYALRALVRKALLQLYNYYN